MIATIVMIVNFIIGWLITIGGVISGVYLVVSDEWGIVIAGVALIVLWKFIGCLLLTPSVLLSVHSYNINENKKLSMFFLVLGRVYTDALRIAWCLIILYVFTNTASRHLTLPVLMWVYICATLPWDFMDIEDRRNVHKQIASFYTKVLFIVALCLFYADVEFPVAATVFSASVVIGGLIHMFLAWLKT
jgi:hypothetical protein